MRLWDCRYSISCCSCALFGRVRLIHFTWLCFRRFVVESGPPISIGWLTSRYDLLSLHVCTLDLHSGRYVSRQLIASSITRSQPSLSACTRPLPDTTGFHPCLCIDCDSSGTVHQRDHRWPMRQLCRTQAQCRLGCHPVTYPTYRLLWQIQEKYQWITRRALCDCFLSCSILTSWVNPIWDKIFWTIPSVLRSLQKRHLKVKHWYADISDITFSVIFSVQKAQWNPHSGVLFVRGLWTMLPICVS